VKFLINQSSSKATTNTLTTYYVLTTNALTLYNQDISSHTTSVTQGEMRLIS